jgi:hypothetical protein
LRLPGFFFSDGDSSSDPSPGTSPAGNISLPLVALAAGTGVQIESRSWVVNAYVFEPFAEGVTVYSILISRVPKFTIICPDVVGNMTDREKIGFLASVKMACALGGSLPSSGATCVINFCQCLPILF